MIEDLRDERLAEALDAAVHDVEPEPARWSSRVVRRGSRRRAARWTAIVASVAIFVAALGWGALQFRRTTGVGGPVSIGSLDTTGWTLTAPSSWRRQDLPACPNAPERTGVILTTVDFEFRNPEGDAPGCEDRYVFAGFRSDGVALALQPVGIRIGPLDEASEDTRFPLSLDRLRTSGGIRGGPQESSAAITIDGNLILILRTWVGSAAPAADVDELAGIVRSLDVAGAIHWTTYRNDQVGFEVTYPEDWIRADTNLTPALSDPHEILSLGTYPLKPGGKACIDAYLPGDALGDLGPDDVFLTVQESSAGPGFPPRPSPFGPDEARLAVDDLPACDEYPPIPMRGWWFAFQDHGRGLYAFLAIGRDVAPKSETWRTAWQVLNGLRFDPN
jgi:hypothetical protein